MIWNPGRECMPREELQKLQLTYLKETVARMYHSVPYYKEKFDAMNVSPDDLKTLDDIRRFPFTTKEDLRKNYPFGLFMRPMDEIVRVHASSGTTGNPTVVGYTRNDMEIWTDAVARLVSAAGVTNKDIVQIAFGYGLFTGGFGLHYGCERVGATVVPISSGNTKRQIKMMRDFGSTVLVATPSYAIHIGEVLEEMGLSKEDVNLKVGLFGGEATSPKMAEVIEAKLGLFATDNYGMSEIVGPGVSGECRERCGMHISEDLFMVEVVNPETMEPVPYGEKGEFVFTTLRKEAFPVFRYRTKDIGYLMPEKCKCGRTTVRMSKILGRTDDMLVIRGVNVFPSQIQEVLAKIDETAPHFLIILDRESGLDTVEVMVEMHDSMFFDQMKKLRELEKRIYNDIHSALGLHCKIKLVEPKTLERTAGKSKRVLDRRNVYEQ